MSTELNQIDKVKKSISNNVKCSIQILSPIHIGSGVKLQSGYDFVTTDQTTTVIKQNDLFDYLSKNKSELDKVINSDRPPLSVIRKLPEGRNYHFSCTSKEIFEFERNGFGIPYIPGSSIKGSLRTILIKKLFDDRDEQKQETLLNKVRDGKGEWASEPVVNELFNIGIKGYDSVKANPNYNFMRCISVCDSAFSESDIHLQKVKMLSLDGLNGKLYKWKPFTLFTESLREQSQGELSLRIDSFLFTNRDAQKKLHLDERTIQFTDLFRLCNRYSREKIDREILFFNQMNRKELDSVIVTLQKIKDDIPQEDSEQEKSDCIFRLGWGTGWQTMTGDYIPKDYLNKFRARYRLGKRDYPIFPKTRKIVFEDEKAKSICGWVKLSIKHSEN